MRRGVNAENKAEQDRKRKEKSKAQVKKSKGDSESKNTDEKWDEDALGNNDNVDDSQFNFAKLWPLGVPEENFVNMFWKTGYFCLKAPRKLTKLEKCKMPPSA